MFERIGSVRIKENRMSASAMEEVKWAEFGDVRLNRRLGKLVSELGRQPNQSIPAATKGRAEMEAA
jgi:hypothetical protein